MALSADEREIVSDLISSVRTLAAHVMTLHLQLGAGGGRVGLSPKEAP